MVQRLRAHFDGRVFVPDEPVHLPPNQAVEVQVVAVNGSTPTPDRAEIEDRLRSFARITGTVSCPPVAAESLRRENLYDDR